MAVLTLKHLCILEIAAVLSLLVTAAAGFAAGAFFAFFAGLYVGFLITRPSQTATQTKNIT